VLGRGKGHGLAIPSKTKNDKCPNGLVCEFVSKAKKANKSSDESTVIKIDAELDQLGLKGTRDFYNKVVGVITKHEVTKTNHELCRLMSCKNYEALSA
jgi:hypothetical protein